MLSCVLSSEVPVVVCTFVIISIIIITTTTTTKSAAPHQRTSLSNSNSLFNSLIRPLPPPAVQGPDILSRAFSFTTSFQSVRA
jgi:hypothetical protein